MWRWALKWLGFRLAKNVVNKAVRGGGNRPPLLDIGLGFALLRDRRVPVASKGMALALGGIAVAALIAIELPVEAMVALLLNVPGLGFDLLIDGLEVLAGPVLLGSLFLPRIAPAHVVAQLRAERLGFAGPQPVRPQAARRAPGRMLR